MRHLIAAVAAVVLLGACSSPAPSHPMSCHAQYQAWQHGPVYAAWLHLTADYSAAPYAGHAAYLRHLRTTLKRVGPAVAAVAVYPPPRCADPRRYWHQILVKIQAAARDASTGSGLGALLLAKALLQQIPGLEGRLSAELKQTIRR